MDFDYIIRKLEQQYRNVDNGDTEVWLKNTQSFIIDHFGPTASRARNFADLIHDYHMKKITGIKPDDIINFKNKALEYIQGNIIYLNELRQREQEKLSHVKKDSNLNLSSSSSTKIATNNINNAQLPFRISAELFWTLFSGFVVASFFIGQLFGGAKFDKEKSDYYEEIKSLKSNQQRLKENSSKDSIASHEQDQKIVILRDSIKSMSEDLNKLYLYLGHLQEKK